MLINVGYGNIVNMDKVVSIIRTSSTDKKNDTGCKGQQYGYRCHMWQKDKMYPCYGQRSCCIVGTSAGYY